MPTRCGGSRLWCGPVRPTPAGSRDFGPFHSAVLLYLDAAQKRRFADLVDALSRRRPTLWLSNETTGTLPEIDARLPADLDAHHRFVQTVDGVPAALAGQHGATYETAPFAS